jgi:uncharacterized protein (TIGR02145 family)
VKNKILKIFILLLSLFCSIVVTRCKKLEKEMLVTTGEVTNILTNSADVSGMIIDLGKEGVTQHGHCYSKTPNTSISGITTQLGVPAGTGGFTSQLTGLEAGTTYYVKAYLNDGTNPVYGKEISFSTLAPSVPTISTASITSITMNSAVSGGNITSDGGAEVSERGICWSTSNNPTIADSRTSDAAGTGSFVSTITGLSQGTKYYVRSYATNSAGTAYGNELSFTTVVITIPILTTTSITSVTTISASSGGNITSDGGASVTTRGICWNTSGNPTVADTKTTNGSGTGVFSSNITGLAAGTTYYARAYATNSTGTAYGNELSFTTLSIIIPTLTTTAISTITATSGISGGNITSDGGASVTARGICWSTSTGPTIADSKTTNGTGTGNFASNLSGLVSSTTYYVRAYATNSAGTAYGNELNFTTLSIVIPTLTTTAISTITATAATSGGNIASDGGASVTARGVCWSTSTGPTIADNKTSNSTGTGSFVSNLSGLISSTTYYVRAYATNSAGTAYGNELSFSTLSLAIPTLSTTTITAIKATTASSGGNITSNGGASVTARGVCWSTSTSPTIADSKTINGSGSGSFTSNLSGLAPSSTYYVRAYATNSEGTGYGNELSFSTNLAASTVTDIDGNIYNTVTIGTQVWMMENLKTTRYADGTQLVNGTGVGAIYNDVTTKYRFVYEDLESNAVTYGRLYTWAAVMNGAVSSVSNPSGVQGICPNGWHVPSSEEWTQLINYFGGASTAGGPLKEAGNSHWLYSNVGATNTSGFTGLPHGYKSDSGSFYGLGTYGTYFTSTSVNSWSAKAVILRTENSEAYMGDYDRDQGDAVRCVKD